MQPLPVVEKELLARLYGSLGKDANAMISIDEHNFRVAVWTDRVVGEADFIALTSCVNDKV